MRARFPKYLKAPAKRELLDRALSGCVGSQGIVLEYSRSRLISSRSAVNQRCKYEMSANLPADLPWFSDNAARAQLCPPERARIKCIPPRSTVLETAMAYLYSRLLKACDPARCLAHPAFHPASNRTTNHHTAVQAQYRRIEAGSCGAAIVRDRLCCVTPHNHSTGHVSEGHGGHRLPL